MPAIHMPAMLIHHIARYSHKKKAQALDQVPMHRGAEHSPRSLVLLPQPAVQTHQLPSLRHLPPHMLLTSGEALALRMDTGLDKHVHPIWSGTQHACKPTASLRHPTELL